MFKDNRSAPRYSLILPIQLSFGSQIILLGHTKDISLKSIFVCVKSSVYMSVHEEVKFNIMEFPGNSNTPIEGSASISRVAPGEGIAIYFTKIEEASMVRLQRLIDLLSKLPQGELK